MRKASRSLINLRADLDRYRDDPWMQRRGWWWSERTIWAIVAYRAAQWTRESATSRRGVRIIIDVLYPLVQALTGIEIWPDTEIGPGLRIYHGGNLVINPGTRIGANCVLRQGVTLGVRLAGERDCPIVGDNVEIGAYAQVLGPITIGNRARIGALSVVLHDVPADCTVVGTPARPVNAGP